LATWARDRGASIVALGHTRDDRIETFLMRARQGSRWHGLAGPLPLASSPAWPEGDGVKLGRPLLAFGREELRARLTSTSVEWIEDPSNSADRFERVRVRALIADLAPSTGQKALRVMDGLAQMRAAVLCEARTALARLETSPEGAWLAADQLSALGQEARVRLVEALVMAAGSAETQPRREAVDRLVHRLALSNASSGGVTLSGARIRWEAGPDARISFAQAPARSGMAEGVGPSWTRAEALLADPALAALAV
jgi:tRNA(Ile)-lysidine synthase